MKKVYLIIFLILLVLGDNFAQKLTSTTSLTSRLINYPFLLGVHKDLIDNLYEISRFGKVYINNDSLKLQSRFPQYGFSITKFYEPYLKTYYLNIGDEKDDICVILTFCFDQVIEFSILTKGYANLTNSKIELRHRYSYKKLQMSSTSEIDSTVTVPGYRVTYGEHYTTENWSYQDSKVTMTYYEDIVNQLGIITVSDRKIIKLLPHWCGNCNKRNSWEKVKKYINAH